tara:strand:+ start:5519 stop:6337 length:819 start_codon:yes stop_codon:yes gene_type:complete
VIVKEPKYRKKLSRQQVDLLKVICKFRFVTVPLVSEWQNKDKSTIYERLLVLTEQGYLQKTYEKRWRLYGKPAVYSLSAKGIRAVRNAADGHIAESILRNQYKNSSASLQLVDHSLAVAKLCVQFKKRFGDTMQIFTKTELAKYDEFLRPLPDIYLRKRELKDGRYQHYCVEMIEAGTMTWIIKKRINAHIEWYEENNEEGWIFEDNYPTLLFICGNANTEKRIHRLVDDTISDFDVYTTTNERLESDERIFGCSIGMMMTTWNSSRCSQRP